MPMLKNQRHERFSQELARGKSATEAYELAGFKPSRANASVLKQKQSIIERVSALLERESVVEKKALEIAVEKLAITKERVLEELARIGFANMIDYITIGKDGDPFVDLSALTREQAAAVSEVTVEDFKDGRGEDARDVRRVKFKLHDKKSALVDIGKHLGMFIDRSEVGKPGDFSRLSDEELNDRIEREARELRLAGYGEETPRGEEEAGGRGRTN